MINAKDTFYIMLRDRLAAHNPQRTVGLRGLTRPGILVEENELATTAVPLDIFRLSWTAIHTDTQGPLPLTTMTCEVRYATAGTAGNGGLDRGRLLAQMDSELNVLVGSEPHNIGKSNYTSIEATGAGPTAMATRVCWSDVTFGPQVATAEEIERVATVEVFCYGEAGE